MSVKRSTHSPLPYKIVYIRVSASWNVSLVGIVFLSLPSLWWSSSLVHTVWRQIFGNGLRSPKEKCYSRNDQHSQSLALRTPEESLSYERRENYACHNHQDDSYSSKYDTSTQITVHSHNFLSQHTFSHFPIFPQSYYSTGFNMVCQCEKTIEKRKQDDLGAKKQNKWQSWQRWW